MSRERMEELWLRFLSYGMLAPDEGRELLQAMESDPELRRQLLGDQEIDGLLRSLGAGDHDAESFVKGMGDLPAAESDEVGFLSRLQTRMDREGIFRQEKSGAGKFGSNFGKTESVQYNSSRMSMPGMVNLEGSEEDFAKLLVFHRIISDEQLQKALEDRQGHAAKGGKVETLRETLLRTRAVSSALLFDVLREASKVVETCTKCSAVHQIVYYHPTSRYFCTFCKGTMRVTDPGQSMKWKPGELAASVNEISGTFSEFPAASTPTPSAILRGGLIDKVAVNPLDDPSATGIRDTKSNKSSLPPLPEEDKITLASGGGDETMLDMGVTPRTSSKPKALPKLPSEGPAATPPPAKPPQESAPTALPSWMDNDESLLDYGSPKAAKPPAVPPKAPAPAEPAKAASEPSSLPSWMDNDESLLDYGSPKAKKPVDPMAGETPRTSSKPFELPKDKPTEAAPAGERSIGMVPGGGETMLDMGSAKPFSLPKDKPAATVPPADRSIGNVPGGGETMLGMGDTPRTSSKPKPFELPKDKKPAEQAPALERSIGPLPEGGGTTMLDMGSAGRKPGEASPIDMGATVIPVPGAGETMLDMGGPKPSVGDGSTSIMGSKRAIPAGIPKPPSELPKLPGSSSSTLSNPSYDVTTKQGSTNTGATQPTGSSSSTVDRTQIQNTTPKTGAGGSSAALANQKAMPAEVVQAAKDPNRVFGKYVLMSELGRGGAGVVYKAWDTLILQFVALKFIRNQEDDSSDTSSGSSQIEEFQREARMSVRLRHPNIVRIYELGCMSNRYYLSMEYIEGGNLLAMIHGGKERNTKTRFNSDPLKFLKIMQNIALAVDYAHNTKPPIIHRDLKPHNVLVDMKHNPYVVDFGLAKEVDQGDGATLTGVVKGTPTYMAPEQAEGRNRDVDPRTDVYALGAIMYEMLTGRPPYTGESVPEILRKIATELPERPNDVITKNAIATGDTTSKLGKSKTKGLLVPKPLETICLKALEKGKNDRYQSAKELAEDIDRYLKDEDILAQEPGLYRRIRRKVRQHPLISAATAAVLLAGLSVGVVLKTVGKGDEGKKLVESIVARGDEAIVKQDWVTLRAAADDLTRQDKQHAKIPLFEKALKDHRDLVEKTERTWSSHLDRIRREPLAKVLPGLREEYKRCPELQPKFRDSLTFELNALKGKVLDDARKLIGSGARPAWVEDLVKTSARDGKDQLATLMTLANDPEFKYPTEDLVAESVKGLTQVIEYQGTWSLQVNVAPFAEVTISRAEKELSTDFTPVGLQELEVVGTSYVVELCWPSRDNAQLKVKQEIKDLHHGQTVVIRGDLSKATLTQERK